MIGGRIVNWDAIGAIGEIVGAVTVSSNTILFVVADTPKHQGPILIDVRECNVWVQRSTPVFIRRY